MRQKGASMGQAMGSYLPSNILQDAAVKLGHWT